MSNDKLNIRILFWHFQIADNWKPSIAFNKYHWDNRLSDGWFKVYKCKF